VYSVMLAFVKLIDKYQHFLYEDLGLFSFT
jgi:hypothetical protein